eukprot:3390591-Amphidinium_carterae.1
MPAPPPGSRPRGRAPGPNKKARLSKVATPPSQPARSSETPSLAGLEVELSEALVEEPGGSSCVDDLEGPGGPSAAHPCTHSALCRGTFLESKL